LKRERSPELRGFLGRCSSCLISRSCNDAEAVHDFTIVILGNAR
jgi:hypothetical protein